MAFHRDRGHWHIPAPFADNTLLAARGMVFLEKQRALSLVAARSSNPRTTSSRLAGAWRHPSPRQDRGDGRHGTGDHVPDGSGEGPDVGKVVHGRDHDLCHDIHLDATKQPASVLIARIDGRRSPA